MGDVTGWWIKAQAQAAFDLVTLVSTVISPATDDDVDDINRIYNPLIVSSHVSFDTEPWSREQRSVWLADRINRGYPVLVARDPGRVVAVAWSGPWRDKTAYSRSAEATIAVDPDSTGAGIGRRLYDELLSQLRGLDFHRCYAVIALPNDPSVEFHRGFGFRDVGVLDEVGHKDGVFVSTLLLEYRL